MPSFMHASESGANWLMEWIDMMNQSGDVQRKEIKVVIDATLDNFEGAYSGSKKAPDGMIYPVKRRWPSIALEVGYSQPYNSLLEDVSLLLEGSDGRIGLVILVKLVPLKDNEKSGFVELYTYNKETHKRVKWKRRMRLYPPPINHSRQKITLAWDQVLRNKMAVLLPNSENPPPLKLDDLRELIDEETARYLTRKPRGEDGSDDSEKD